MIPPDPVKFLSGWTPLADRSMAMDGKCSTVEIENTRGDLLILEYAYPGREEERAVAVTIKVLGEVVGTFRGFYSFPFYIGFKIPPFPQEKLVITLEIDPPFSRPGPDGAEQECGLILFHVELLNREKTPRRYDLLERKVENVKDHFSKLLHPSREVQSLPLALLIEPTSRCNMDCVMCARSIPGHPKEEERDLADEWVTRLGKALEGTQAARIQGLGEPLISKNFVPLMNLLEQNHVHVVTFNTNGYLMDEAMARLLVEKGSTFEHFRISFSLDAATEEVYGQIRGKDLKRTITNIRRLQDLKRERGALNPLVLINMTLNRTNIVDLPGFVRLAHELDAQVELSNLAVDACYESIQIRRGDRFLFDYKDQILTAYPKLYNKLLKEAEKLGRELGVTIHRAGDVVPMGDRGRALRHRVWNVLKRALKSHPRGTAPDENRRQTDPSYENLPMCLLPWSQMVINSKGDISLCCVQGPVGHLRDFASIEEAWNSETIRNIRELLSQQIFPSECQLADCTVRKWGSRVCVVHQ